MKKFVDPSHLPSIDKSYTIQGREELRVVWPNSIPWHAFYSKVAQVAQANNVEVPSADVVEDDICSRLPKGWCTGEANYRPPAPQQSTGCRSCGGW